MSDILKSIATTLVSCLVSLLLVEGGLRLWHGVPVFALTDFRGQHKPNTAFKGLVRYDANLGWVMADHHSSGQIHTVDHGIRRSSVGQKAAHEGGILVSGSSFTAGSGVEDWETWPAFLENETGIPVNNAAVGGWGLDQVVLRAEDLLEKTKPDVLMVDIMDTTIRWAGYSILTNPKPYFVVEDGRLTRPEPTVPRRENQQPEDVGILKKIAGHIYVADRIMAIVDARSWYAQSPRSTAKTNADPVEVTCELVRRLALKAAEANIRFMVVSVPTGQEIQISEKPSSVVAHTEECLAGYDIHIAPIRERLLEAIKNETITPGDFFQVENGQALGHLTSEGNKFIAAVVTDELARQPPAVDFDILSRSAVSDASVEAASTTGNLLQNSERLEEVFTPNTFAQLQPAGDSGDGPRQYEFRFSGLDPKNRAFLVGRDVPVEPGSHVFSIDVRPDRVEDVIFQIWSHNNGSTFAGFNFEREEAHIFPAHFALGRSWRAGMSKGEDGWYRLWMKLDLPEATVRMMVGLGDEGGHLTPFGQSARVQVRAPQIEQGARATAYQSTSVRPAAGDGVNLLPDGDALVALLNNTSNLEMSVDSNFFSPDEYMLKASGGEGEHYVRFPVTVPEDGTYVFSFQARSHGTDWVRVQLFDEAGDGGLADVNLRQESVRSTRLGGDRGIQAGVFDVDKDRKTVSIAGTFRRGPVVITVQILDNKGSSSFSANQEKIIGREFRLQKAI